MSIKIKLPDDSEKLLLHLAHNVWTPRAAACGFGAAANELALEDDPRQLMQA